MIKTGNYKNFGSCIFKTVSISGGRGKGANYTGECYSGLAPKLSFWKKWHENIGAVPEKENDRYYIEQYYNQVLSKLDPEKVYKDLDHSILLCYEDSEEFCHRHIVAAWLELLLDEKVSEAVIEENKIIDIERPDYVKEVLEKVMKEEKNMRGFTCLRAAYLFEKAESLEEKANELEEKTGKIYGSYRQEACYLRCDADEAEAEYRSKCKKIFNRK